MEKSFRCIAIDVETHIRDNYILKVGAYRSDLDRELIASGAFNLVEKLEELDALADGAQFVAGHNIIAHDLQVLRSLSIELNLFNMPVIDTLRVSPLAFPQNPYHRLVKGYKLIRDSLSDPLIDAKLCLELLEDEVSALKAMAEREPVLFKILCWLITSGTIENGIRTVMPLVGDLPETALDEVREGCESLFKEKVCSKQLDRLLHEEIADSSLHLSTAYALSWINVSGGSSILPPWVKYQFPGTGRILKNLRDIPCNSPECPYCSSVHNPGLMLKRYFAFEKFRPVPQNSQGGSLQEDIVTAGFRGEHLLAILPTGTGKSLCYQLPALLTHYRNGSLTLVISPLQALMKDQVDSLLKRGIISAATLNGLLSMPERKDVLERTRLGDVSILLVSPEQLRNRSFRDAIRHREIGAWVFDEAHCLSKWGHDFRPDYLYAARFIRETSLNSANSWTPFRAPGDTAPEQYPGSLPQIACFTATAKESVIEDILGHFREQLGIEMRVFRGGLQRENLRFCVMPAREETKRGQIHQVLESYIPPGAPGGAIVFTAFRRSAEEISSYLEKQGWSCGYFHGGLTPETKKQVQQDFISGQIKIIVATNAFGMGIDKPDVRLVIHAEIPGSLENYLQEAGRAGRDLAPADCVLFYDVQNIEDQFRLIAQSRLSRKDIAEILRALRKMKVNEEGTPSTSTGY